MPTLHSNNPVPSNGSVATVIRGVKSISMTLAGVGAVRAVVQIMAHEDGAAPGPIGNQIVVSGTTTVTTTQTFNAEAGEVYLQLIDITPACKFSATLTELGPIQDTNPGSPSAPFATTADLLAAMSSAPLRTVVWFANPNVLWLASRVWRVGLAGTIADWVPVPGEVIVSKWRTDDGPVIPPTIPGVLTLTKLYESPVIPDIFLPARGIFQHKLYAYIRNAAGLANSFIGAGLSGSEPTAPSAEFYKYPLESRVTPSTAGLGAFSQTIQQVITNGRTLFKHPTSGAMFERNSIGPFVAGANRFYLMGQASKIDDEFNFDGHETTFIGY